MADVMIAVSTQGRATATMLLSHYARLPAELTTEVLQAR